MKVSVLGAGYVGLVAAACLAKLGHRVILMDVDEKKISAIRKGECPLYEQGLPEMLRSVPLEATLDLEYAITRSELSLICVATQDSSDAGSVDMTPVVQAVGNLAPYLKQRHVVVVKSSVLPGTTTRVLLPLLEERGKRRGQDFVLCFNPEFLREGVAVQDFLHPSRIIIGEMETGDGDPLVALYQPLSSPLVRVDPTTAEMIKFAANAYLAARLSFINEVGNICKALGVDSRRVAEGMGYDPRIGKGYLNAGIGFGGSCLPKDLKALSGVAREAGCQPKLLQAAWEVNQAQPEQMLRLLKLYVPVLKDKSIGVLGLAFKANTDDVRQSPALGLIHRLLAEGARVTAYDPCAMENCRRLLPQIKYAPAGEVLSCEAVLIATDWPEFHELDYRGKLVIDGRGIAKAREARIYEGLCW